ncbi:hypothetical protein GALMADRAFT_240462 [Galerina marginata CBS 339.88]|uniref:F-box domain-containing protein n=1 Tax=Galerina marginata (strain CBS 339.88) TaxID=685588 RepID=A0A067TFW9_GALM3|nr:hypothetical protein GALMADRAFT_240462 [Galerina marginata CBS 339.88]
MSPILPLELEEIILSYLRDDPSALQAWALTCHRFVHPAQAYIFQRVELVISSVKSAQIRWQRFIALLESSPHISNLITELSLALDSPHRVSIGTAATLPVIIGLRSIDLIDWEAGFDWDAFPAVEQTLLTTMIQQHSLVNLRLSNIFDLSLMFLEGLISLEGLFLENVTFCDDDRKSLLNDQWTRNDHLFDKSPHLKFLRLDLIYYAFNVFVRWITHPNCPFDISSLQGLALSMNPVVNWLDYSIDINANINTLLQFCSKSLRVFCYGPGFRGLETPEPAGLINIKCLSNLHTLRIAIREPIRSDFFNSRAVEFFGQIKGCKLLSEVSIKVVFTIIKQPPSVAALLDTIAALTQPCPRTRIFVYRDSNEYMFPKEWKDEWMEVLKVEVPTTMRMQWAQSCESIRAAIFMLGRL